MSKNTKAALTLLVAGGVSVALYYAYRHQKTPKKLIDKYHQKLYYLTSADAQDRSQKVTNVSYFLKLNLAKGEDFWAYCKIKFSACSIGTPMHLDFHCEEILSYAVNGKVLDPK